MIVKQQQQFQQGNAKIGITSEAQQANNSQLKADNAVTLRNLLQSAKGVLNNATQFSE